MFVTENCRQLNRCFPQLHREPLTPLPHLEILETASKKNHPTVDMPTYQCPAAVGISYLFRGSFSEG